MTVGRSSSPTHQSGAYAEHQACAYLQAQGLMLVGQNCHNRYGEWDLIMLHDQVLVFVEVRFRRSASFGSAVASVSRQKQRKLINAAQQFLLDHPAHASRECRFDVVAYQGDCAKPEWICAAFDATEQPAWD